MTGALRSKLLGAHHGDVKCHKKESEMDKLKCPHCDQPGITFFQKMCLGPIFSTKCKSCGQKVGVPYKAVLAVTIVPLLMLVYVSTLIEQVIIWVILWGAGSIIMLFIHMKYVPLEAR